MSKRDALRIPDFLEHILEAISRIEHYTEDMIEVTFLTCEMSLHMVIFKLTLS